MTAFLEENSRLVSRKAFVRTYNPRSHTDPVELLDEYFHVIDYATRHPEQPSETIATNLDLPERRVERWIRFDGPVIPSCVRGLETAERNGWIAIDLDSEMFQGMNILVAACFASGTITPRSWIPTFSIPNSSSLQRIITAMKWIDAGYELKRESRQSPVSKLAVKTAPAVLGRVLYVLGAPLDNTTGQSIHLPEYIEEVGQKHREAFVKTYLKNQGIEPTENETLALEADVNGHYLDQLRELVEDVAGEPIDCDGTRLLIPEQSARTLGIG